MMDQLFGYSFAAEVTSVLLKRAGNGQSDNQNSLCLSLPRLSWALIELISCLIGPLRPSSEFSGSAGAFLNRLTTQIVKGEQICQVGRIIASTGYFGEGGVVCVCGGFGKQKLQSSAVTGVYPPLPTTGDLLWMHEIKKLLVWTFSSTAC